MTATPLDSTDRQLLEALQQDARTTIAELAQRVSLSPSPCWRRVRQLEESGVIAGYHARLSRDKLGYGWTSGIPALATGDFTLATYAGLTAGHGVIGAVFMETGVDDADYKAEARLVSGLVGQSGLMGQVASCRPEEDAK